MKELTVRQAADHLEITVQTVYRRLKRLDPDKKYQINKNGITHITAEGLELIDSRPVKTEPENQQADKTTRELIDLLKQQIVEKDKQIAELTKLANANATLLAQRQQVDLIAADSGSDNSSSNAESRPGFFARLKNRFSNSD